jgi:hypothetical protein
MSTGGSEPREWTGARAGPLSISESDSLPQVGSTLDVCGTRYEILRSLGRGGMAEVLLARRHGAGGFSRLVALKCLQPDLELDEPTRQRFVEEAGLQGLCDHPNIAEAYDLIEVVGRYYLVLEYVDGTSARELIRIARERGRPLSEGLACYVVASVADALHHAHTRTGHDGAPLGLVHRDVSSANVMVTRSGEVKLLDFGIAFAQVSGRAKTRTGLVRGTVAYLSPEQALGLPVDGRSDLFSLGLIFVELLTGRRVFEDDAGELVTAQAIAASEPGAVKEATRSLPRALQRICMKALARKPENRFRDGAEFARVLRDYYVRSRERLFVAADCAAETTALCVSAGEGAREPARPAAAEPPRPRTWKYVVAAVAAIIVGLGTAWRVRTSSQAAPPPPAAVVVSEGRKPDLVEPRVERAAVEPAPAAQKGAVESAPPIDSSIVRPKMARAARTKAVAGPTPSAPVAREEPQAAASERKRSEQAKVQSERLPRGTLLPAKVVSAVDATRPARVEAVTTDDVTVGTAIIARGSAVECRSRSVEGERLPLICSSARSGERQWAFSGIGVGESERVGLRIIDSGTVRAGTPFVVYVRGPAFE